MSGSTPPASDSELAALERFVVDNDDLLELEERIGRFNIFDALGVVRAEIRHSSFLAWLLDPKESHGQGGLFLKAILMDLLKEAPPKLRPLSPVELDGEELRGVVVQREWKNIDLLITCKEPPFVIAIENKIDSGEHSGQLKRSKKVVHEQFRELHPMFVFLTTDASEPSDEQSVPYSYADIHRVLDRVRRTGHGAIGDDVEAFLEHYLRLIGSRFMDDSKIDELCQRIYKNHRQAIDLIRERTASRDFEIVDAIIEHAKANSWSVARGGRTTSILRPVSWEDGEVDTDYRPTSVVEVRLVVWKCPCYIEVRLGPCEPPDRRNRILDRLTANEDFGFRRPNRVADQYTSLTKSHTFATWKDGDDLPIQKCVDEFGKWSDRWMTRLASVPDALRPIIAEWEQSQ